MPSEMVPFNLLPTKQARFVNLQVLYGRMGCVSFTKNMPCKWANKQHRQLPPHYCCKEHRRYWTCSRPLQVSSSVPHVFCSICTTSLQLIIFSLAMCFVQQSPPHHVLCCCNNIVRVRGREVLALQRFLTEHSCWYVMWVCGFCWSGYKTPS